MDSLSQIVLGAACCGAVAPRLGRRALVYGAVLGTLPDLDTSEAYGVNDNGVVVGQAFDGSGMGKYQDILEIVDRNHWILRSQLLGDDGQWHPFMEGHHRRV